MYRIDFIFSYWIFVWYILYILKLTNYNPKLALILGLIENSFLLFLMIYYKSKIKYIISFFIAVIVTKLIPLLTIYKTKIIKNDFIYLLVVFLIYMIWLTINKIDLIDFYKKISLSVIRGENKTPFIYIFDKIFDNTKKNT